MSIKTNVVVIDSGVNINHEKLSKANISGISISRNEDSFIVSNDIIDKQGHGTAVCATIHNQCKDIEIYMVKIFDEELSTDIDILNYALYYIYENIDCQVINLSLGLNKGNQELYNICEKLTDKDVVIVSAFDNAGAISYPAAYDNVIGVDAHIKCMKINDFVWIDNSLVNVLAKGGNHRLAWVGNNYIIGQGSSFSAPYVTSSFLNLISSGIGNKDLIKEFKKITKKNIDVGSCSKQEIPSMFRINKASIFPYNKEVHSILNFTDLLNFSIDKVYDTRHSGNLNKVVYSVDGKNKFNIYNIENVCFDKIDTFILGHVGEINHITSVDYKKIILEKCLENNVNVYSFDDALVDEYKEKFIERNLNIFVPKIKIDSKVNKANKLYKISSPVVGVFGTTKQQGKHTLQLQLRRRFISDGYNVGQLGTEPNALLFGMDEVYPFGYEGDFDENSFSVVDNINTIMHEIDSKDPDVILVGSQSGTVPMLFENLGQIPLKQIEFLIGSMPDAVIVCVNLFDDIDYIKRTKLMIENLCDTKVISLGIYPMVSSNDWKSWSGKRKKASQELIYEFKNTIKENIGLDSYVIGDEQEIEMLYDKCITFFSS